MGTYTGLVIAVELKKDTPQDVVDVLKALCGDIRLMDLDLKSIELDDQTFFKCERWTMVLNGDSYYVAGNTVNSFAYDEVTGSYTLTARSNLKNYDGEIELFLEWLAPYSDTGSGFVEFVGYKLPEGGDPVLIYFEMGKVKYHFSHSGYLD